MIKLEYKNNKIFIDCETNMEYRSIKEWFNRYVENYMFSPLYKNKLWNGKRTGLNVTEMSVPIGLWQEIYRCAKERELSVQFTNKKDFPLNRNIDNTKFVKFVEDFFDGFEYKGKPFEVRPYQLRVAYNILKNRYCNIAVATSGGKTLIYALTLLYLLNEDPSRKFLLVVPSKTLVTQFYDDLVKFDWNNKLNINIQEIFDSTEKPRLRFDDKDINLYIGTYQSLTNKELYPTNWFKQFYSSVVDEGHHAKSDSYIKILSKCKNAYYRWGMSGSYPEIDSYEMMQIMSKTGPIVDTVKARELIDAGYITDVRIKSVLMYHNDYEFAKLLEIVASKDKKSAYDLEQSKIQESNNRLALIKDIVNQCQSNTLVLFHNTEYGKTLLEYLSNNIEDKEFYYIDGKVSNKKRKPIIEAMDNDNGKVKILVASFGTLSTGISIDTLTNIIFTQSFKKPRIIIQSIGRGLRLHEGKSMCYIFDLVDIFNHDEYADDYYKHKKFKNILYTHWQKRLKIYIGEEFKETRMKINLDKYGNKQ